MAVRQDEHGEKQYVRAEKPWGNVRDPVYLEPYLDENQLRVTNPDDVDVDAYERGVWYTAGYPLTDHHDMAGLPNAWRDLQTLLGLEYRPTFWINIYNRLRNLDFPDVDEERAPRPLLASTALLSAVDIPKRIPSKRSWRSKGPEICMLDAEDGDHEDFEDDPLTMLTELPGKGDLMLNKLLTGIQRKTSGLITSVGRKMSSELF